MWWPSISSYISLYYRRYVPSVSYFLIPSRCFSFKVGLTLTVILRIVFKCFNLFSVALDVHNNSVSR